MEVQRLLILPLLLLATLCSTGVSLKCYSCLDPVASCRTNATCSVNVDSCLVAVSDKFLKALKDEKLQGLKTTRQPGKSASVS
ncbi:CD59 glycoprotein isoform X2 [Cricetulus griseus]|uniref:CD59 glycoprotein isoform X2 n=1 Tax=Cricetulus griseus TaxID=10029 RepID=UPI0004545466|nr:CD59 glycoprotein isoform X2 [Cricetulus griseus]